MYFLYENICVANHGVTIGYSEEGNPILKNDEDCELYDKIYHEVQTNIINKFLKIHSSIRFEYNATEFKRYSAIKHAKMLLCFNKKELDFINQSKKKRVDGFISINGVSKLRRLASAIKKKIKLFIRYIIEKVKIVVSKRL